MVVGHAPRNFLPMHQGTFGVVRLANQNQHGPLSSPPLIATCLKSHGILSICSEFHMARLLHSSLDRALHASGVGHGRASAEMQRHVSLPRSWLVLNVTDLYSVRSVLKALGQ